MIIVKGKRGKYDAIMSILKEEKGSILVVTPKEYEDLFPQYNIATGFDGEEELFRAFEDAIQTQETMKLFDTVVFYFKDAAHYDEVAFRMIEDMLGVKVIVSINFDCKEIEIQNR